MTARGGANGGHKGGWRLAGIAVVGLTMGLTAGLVLAWQWLPLSFIEATPADLGVQYREAYIRLIAATYANDQDWEAAQTRLKRLRAGNIGQWVTDLAIRESKVNPPVARDLAQLARALGMPDETLTELRPSPTTVSAPTVAVTPTPVTTFMVVSRRLLSCRNVAGPAQARVFVRDRAGQGLPGVRLVISGGGNREYLFTGLKGEDPGYADFDVSAGTFNLAVDLPGSEVVTGLDTGDLDLHCPSSRSRQNPPHGWEVVFQQVPVPTR